MFPDNLKKIRKEKKLTQQYMADKLGISRPKIYSL
nr:helix-turn-helix transcriptional regulator [Bacillus pumilus]